jgi:quercetin dioxygenase-like cupin family protein
LSKDLAEVPGKQLSMITVDYSPGESSPAHTHDAQAMVYVLEGSIVMQAKGKEGRAKPGMRDRMTCTSSAETRAIQRRRSTWCSW